MRMSPGKRILWCLIGRWAAVRNAETMFCVIMMKSVAGASHCDWIPCGGMIFSVV